MPQKFEQLNSVPPYKIGLELLNPGFNKIMKKTKNKIMNRI